MEKRKILFVLEGFSNLSEANAICVNDIIIELNYMGVNCTVISVENSVTSNLNNIITCEYSYSSKKNKYLRMITKLIFMPIGRLQLVREIQKKIDVLLKNDEYAALIAVINPVESAEAVKNSLKKFNKVKSILYEIDPASNRYKNPKNIFEKYAKYRSIKWEKRIYSIFDVVVHMETHREHFSNLFNNLFVEKTVFWDIPSLKVNILKKKTHEQNNPFVFLYAGAFYPKLRNPDRMIEIFIELIKTYAIDFKLEIYTGSNMFSHIEELIYGFEDNISVHHYIKQDELNEVICNADVLVDLGNSDSDFLPSKPFHYMGTGKPIIHFSPDRNDVSLDYIKKYNNSLIIDQNSNDKDILTSILAFLNSLNQRCLPEKEELEMTFEKNTAKYTARRIVDLLNG